MITLITSVIAFSLIILILSIIIIIAGLKLLPQGFVNIIINDNISDPITIEPGASLLTRLNEKEIYLPSACGGRGTCGACTCQVEKGGGDILPTELGAISRKMAKEKWRLACQVKVREDMQIKIPEEIFSIKKIECEVVSNKNVATFIKELVFKLPDGENLEFKPGGYIQIEVPHYKIDFKDDVKIEKKFQKDWQKYKVFDLKICNREICTRAYSMANHPAEGNLIKLNVRIATPPLNKKRSGFAKYPPGVASSYLFNLKAKDKVIITGPYGDFYINDSNREMVYIGGGVGMAPLRSHVFHLLNTEKSKRKISFWYGARSKRDIFYYEEFKALEKKNKNFNFNIALSEPQSSDKWKGNIGFIHQVVYEQYLKNHDSPEEIEYYLCGPPLMIEAVNKMLYNLGVDREMIKYDDFG